MAEQKSGNKQRGSSFWGFMGGLVVGVGVASAVALYITKVPTPFMNRNQPRSADQDVAEQKRNSTWDPNAGLYGRNPAPRPAAPAPVPEPVPAPAPEPVRPPAATTRTPAATARTPVPSPDEGAPVEPVAAPPRTARATANATATATANSNAAATGGGRSAAAGNADPLGELVNRTESRIPAPKVAAATPAPATADGYNYVLQVGAYNSMADAESQRARLSMQGIDSRITERDVNGRTVYRVRVGPFDNRDAAERAKDRLDASGSVSTMLRVQR